MDKKTYRIDIKRTTEEEKSSSIQINAINNNSLDAKVNVSLELYNGLVLTDAYHSFQLHIDKKERKYLTMTTVPEYKVSPNIKDVSKVFSHCRCVKEIDATAFAGTHPTDMGAMFSQCSALKYVNLAGVDTSMSEQFGNMFWGCKSLERIDGIFDLSGIKEEHLGRLNNMFWDCPSTLKVKFKNVPTNFFDKVQNRLDPGAHTCPERMGLKLEQVEIVN